MNKKSIVKNYRIICLASPNCRDGGVSVSLFINHNNNITAFYKNEIEEFKKIENNKIYGICDFMNLFCNKFNYSIVSNVPILVDKIWCYYITLIKD